MTPNHTVVGSGADGAATAPYRLPPWRSATPVRALSLLLLLALWQLAAWISASPTLPSPVEVAARMLHEAASGVLGAQLAVTLLRVLVSFAVAMLIGVLIGIAMGRWRKLDTWLDPWLVLGLNLPALVTIILCYVWFGLNDTAAIVAVAINKIPVVVVTVREGARAIDAQLTQVARAFVLDRWRTLRYVVLPQLFPYLMAAARSGLSLIWKIVLVVELLGRSNGVGYQLHLFFQLFDIAGILAYALAFAGVVLLIEAALLRPLEARVTRWRRC